MAGGPLGRAIVVAVTASTFAACSPIGGDNATDITGSISTEDILIDPTAPAIPIDHRLFGTNLPAWGGPAVLADEALRAATVESGTTLLRLPGGSWSNAYDWLGCEVGDEERCYWTWAARPTDFIDFLHATGIPGSWTVNVNQSAEAAAAAVAFFNGDPDDERVIGPDRDGVDWGTVGRWATLRVENGNPEPAAIKVWEVGNEVYGGRPEVGGNDCAPFGWEDVWTCDGSEYTVGDEDQDGYLDFRRAMRAVDPTIEVGAVGVAPPSSWSEFGNEVIAAAGDELDFYVIHSYGFDRSPDPDDAVRRPEELVPELVRSVRAELPADIPIAVTEYNLVSFEGGDHEQAMRTAQNALYVADVLGQLAIGGVAIGNQWNLVNGLSASGTDYGLLRAESFDPNPQWEALNAWSHVGTSLLPTSTAGDLHVYPTLHDDGRITIVALNLSSAAITRSVSVADAQRREGATLHTSRTNDLTARNMARDETVELTPPDEPLDITFPAWSINRVELDAPR